jgi:formamidopyrimidine-DNA glycosylase
LDTGFVLSPCPGDGPVPELPEITAYVRALEQRVLGQVLEKVRIRTPSLLKTFDPRVSDLEGRRVNAVRRVGKRIVFELEEGFFAVVHLMISGRLRWTDLGAIIPKKRGHAAFDFSNGSLLLTEASTHKRASLHAVRGEAALAALDPGGVEPLEADYPEFRKALLRENRTLKRALTDPRILSGIGNAHSDEILLDARLSPVRRTRQLDEDELRRLYDATRNSLAIGVERLRIEFGDEFPKKITAFHEAMMAHGKFGQPCPKCDTPIQRIVYGKRETNYCPNCQTGGKLLKDRALSKLLREDWPSSLEEMEEAIEAKRPI